MANNQTSIQYTSIYFNGLIWLKIQEMRMRNLAVRFTSCKPQTGVFTCLNLHFQAAMFGQIIVDSEEFLVVEVQQPWYRKVQGWVPLISLFQHLKKMVGVMSQKPFNHMNHYQVWWFPRVLSTLLQNNGYQAEPICSGRCHQLFHRGLLLGNCGQ